MGAGSDQERHDGAVTDERWTINVADRHPSTQQIARWFSYRHLASESHARSVSAECSELAEWVIGELPDSPELVAGLRKLLEAKDCFVRAAIAASEPAQ